MMIKVKIFYYKKILNWLTLCMLVSVPAYGENPFKLKADARGGACLNCHDKIKEAFANKNLHPLMKKKNCAGCHESHTCSFKPLLIKQTTKLCYDCHQEALFPSRIVSAHEMARKGECTRCHSAHGSSNDSILKQPSGSLCFDCHQDKAAKVTDVRFKHAPLLRNKSCLSCHTAHASENAGLLRQKGVPEICWQCHKKNKPSFKNKHQNYNVVNSNCISCHDPHGSNTKGQLFDSAHEPVAKRNCTNCHLAAEKSSTAKLKKQGLELCKQCHTQWIGEEILSKKRIHSALFGKKGCLNCHGPHASKAEKLMAGIDADVCGKCHIDTLELQNLAKTDPKNERLCEPIKSGRCTACHSPHAADTILLMPSANFSIDVCGQCHEWQKHSSHPIGEKAIDPRNQNLTVECISCHKACGTMNNPSMMPFPTVYDMCTQCHTDRKR